VVNSGVSHVINSGVSHVINSGVYRVVNSQLFTFNSSIYTDFIFALAITQPIVVSGYFYSRLSIFLYCCPFAAGALFTSGSEGFSALSALMVLPVVYGRRATRQRGSDAAAMSTVPCPAGRRRFSERR
jgi:hypothetical protein